MPKYKVGDVVTVKHNLQYAEYPAEGGFYTSSTTRTMVGMRGKKVRILHISYDSGRYGECWLYQVCGYFKITIWTACMFEEGDV